MNEQEEKALFDKALSKFSKNEFQTAIDMFLKLTSEDIEMDLLKNYYLGLSYVRLGQYKKGLTHYKKIQEIPKEVIGIKYDSIVYKLYINMGSVMQHIGRQEMKEAMKNSLDIQEAKHLQGKSADSPTVIEKEKRIKESPHKKLLKEAATCYKWALQVNDTDHQVWNNLGNAYLDISEYGKAHAAFDKSIKIHDAFGAAHYCKSLAYQFTGQYSQAIDSLKKAIKIHNRKKSYLIKVIALLFANERVEEAAAFAEKLMEYHPDDINGFKHGVLIYYNLGQYEKAYEVYQIYQKFEEKNVEPEVEGIFKDLLKRINN